MRGLRIQDTTTETDNIFTQLHKLQRNFAQTATRTLSPDADVSATLLPFTSHLRLLELLTMNGGGDGGPSLTNTLQ